LCRSRIPSFLKRVAPWTKIVFILRNPIDRAHSAWKMEYNTPAHEVHPGFRDVVDKEVSQMRSLKLSLAPTWSEIVARNLTSRSFRARPPVWQRTGLGDALQPVRQAKIRNLQCGHLSRGLYAQQLIPWIEAFGRDNILILRFEDFESNQTAVLQQILDFVGIVDHSLQRIADADLEHQYNPRNQVQRRTGKVGGDMREYLRRFYQPYNEELADLLGDKSWKKVWD
jgi:Sulfotransferase domain